MVCFKNEAMSIHPVAEISYAHKTHTHARHTIVTRVDTLSSMQLAGNDLKALMCQAQASEVTLPTRLKDPSLFDCVFTLLVKNE